jgi:hypothetical protein
MKSNDFDNLLKGIYDHEEIAPNVMEGVFERRSAWYIFRNRLFIQKYKLMAAAVLLITSTVIVTGLMVNNNSDSNAITNLPITIQKDDSNISNNGINSESKSEIIASEVSEDGSLITPDESGSPIEVTNPDRAEPNSIVIDIKDNDSHKPTLGQSELSSDPTDGMVLDESPAKEGGPTEQPGTTSTEIIDEVENEIEDQVSDKTHNINQPTLANTDDNVSEANEPNDQDDENLSTEENQEVTLPDNPPLSKFSVSVSYAPSYAYRNLDKSVYPMLAEIRDGAESPLYSQQAFVGIH